MKAGQGYGQIAECQVMGVSTRGKVTHRARIEFSVHAGAEGNDELLSIREQHGRRTSVRVRSVSDLLKDICSWNRLPPD